MCNIRYKCYFYGSEYDTMLHRFFIFLFALLSIHGYMLNAQQGGEFEEGAFSTSDFSPVKIVKLGSGHYFLDFGRAYFGTVMLKTEKDVMQPFTLCHGEKGSAGTGVDRNPGGSIRFQEVTIEGMTGGEWVRADIRADKRNTNRRAIALPDTFGVIMPFRYCELMGLSAPIEVLNVIQRAYHYRFNDEASLFTSSDTLLNRIWDLCKHTIKATSFAGYYVDGDRERIPYEADAFINQLSHYAVDSVYSIARRTNLYFLDHPTWPTEWILHVVPLFYYRNMVLFSRIAKAVGNNEDYRFFTEKAIEVKHTINRTLFDSTRGIYTDGIGSDHAWGSAPANIITRYLWGIRPVTPGFSTVTIEPQLTGLSTSEIKVPTAMGAITGRYERTDRITTYEFNLPAGMKGEFVLPGDPLRVTLNHLS